MSEFRRVLSMPFVALGLGLMLLGQRIGGWS